MNAAASANVARFLAVQAAERPDATALLAPLGRERDGSIRYERLSFADLHAQSEQVAHAMTRAGLRRGMRVLLMVKPGSDLIRCCFALFKTGAVPVVIDPGMGLKSFLNCVRRTEPEALVGIPLAHLISRFFPSTFHTVRHRVRVGRSFADWYGAEQRDGFPIAEPSTEDLAAILFTSGSTGAPKGVQYGHGQFDAQVRLVRDTFGIEPGEVDLPMLPVFALFNPALGMTTVVPEMNPGKPAKVDPEKILRAIEQCGVTNSFGSPVLWKKIGRHAAAEGRSFPRMRRILMAGAPVPPALVELLGPVFPQARLWSPYGATECLPVTAIDGQTISTVSAARSAAGAGTCVGRPVAGVHIRIIPITEGAIERLADAPGLSAGEIGEIIATGPTVTRAYDKLPEATALAKITDEAGGVWHRMGDAGYLDEAGRLWFCGRLAERVITPAGPLYTDCVEGIFNALPGVGRSALIGLGAAPRQRPAIVIEPEPGARLDPKDLLLAAHLHHVAKSVNSVFYYKAFPVDVRHNAKIHRLTLAAKFKEK